MCVPAHTQEQEGRGKPLGARTFSVSRKTIVERKLKLPGRVRTCGRGAGAPLRPDFPRLSACPAGQTLSSVLAAPWRCSQSGLASAPRQRPQEGKNLPGGHGCRSLGIGPFLLLLEGADLISFSESWMLVAGRQQALVCLASVPCNRGEAAEQI